MSRNLGLVRLGREFAPFVKMDAGDDFALFNRQAQLKGVDVPPVRDRFFPGWLLAIFNAGYREMFQDDLTGTATFLMNFYEPNGHDHPDALNIAMFAEGVEVLSDLGYIGDHPLNASIRSTLKHNLVVVDEKDQLPRRKRPPGNVGLLATSPHVKVIAADCGAYEGVGVYQRQCVMVHRGNGPAYVVDCFGVQGGKVHDYAIHGEGLMTLMPTGGDGKISLRGRKGVMGGDIEKLRVGQTNGMWSAAWTDEGMTMRVRFVSPTEQVIVGEGPGQRDHSEIGARNDYLFARRREQSQGNSFVTVIDHYRDQPEVVGVDALRLPEGASGSYAIKVSRTGGTDVVMGGDGAAGDWTLAGQAAVYSQENDGRQSLFLAGGTQFSAPNLSVTLAQDAIAGMVVDQDRDGFVSDVAIPGGGAMIGCFVEVDDPRQKCRTAYAIQGVKGRKILVDEFPFHAGTAFRIPSMFWMEECEQDTYVVRSNVRAEVRVRTAKETACWERNGKSVEASVKRDGEYLVMAVDPRVVKADEMMLK